MARVKLVSALIAVCFLSASFIACGGGVASIDFEDTLWYLDSYGEQGNMKSVMDDTLISVTFDSEEGRMHGNGGCNSYFAGYELDDGFSVSPVGRTEMYCAEPEGVMDQEDEYLKILGSANDIGIEDGKLNITGSEGVLVFIKSTGQ